MPRSLIFLAIIIVLIAAALWFLSGQAEEIPTRMIETDVSGETSAR